MEKQGPYRVENIVRKGEIACYKQFLLFSPCFPQLYIFSASKCGTVWYGVNASAKSIDPCHPAQFVQADMGQNLLLFLHSLSVKKTKCRSRLDTN